MGVRRTKLVEIPLRVRVPRDWSPTIVRREIAGHYFGEIYALGPPVPNGAGFLKEATLHPRWGRARVVKAES